MNEAGGSIRAGYVWPDGNWKRKIALVFSSVGFKIQHQQDTTRLWLQYSNITQTRVWPMWPKNTKPCKLSDFKSYYVGFFALLSSLLSLYWIIYHIGWTSRKCSTIMQYNHQMFCTRAANYVVEISCQLGSIKTAVHWQVCHHSSLCLCFSGFCELLWLINQTSKTSKILSISVWCDQPFPGLNSSSIPKLKHDWELKMARILSSSIKWWAWLLSQVSHWSSTTWQWWKNDLEVKLT